MKSQRYTSMFFTITTLWLLLAGCAHRQQTDPNVPAAPPTPFEQALALNASFAHLNNAVAKGVIRAESIHAIDAHSTEVVTEVNFKVAAAHKELTKILALGPAAAGKRADDIEALIDQLQASVIKVVNDGTINVTNPEQKQAIIGNLNAVYALADSIVETLKLAGVLK